MSAKYRCSQCARLSTPKAFVLCDEYCIKMPSRKSTKAIASSFTPTLTLDTALARLQRLLKEIPELYKEQNLDRVLLDTWRNNVQGVLAQFYGKASLQYEHFDQISFYPHFMWDTPSSSEYVRKHLDGLSRADAFLQSRIGELEEDARESKAQPLLPKTLPPMSKHKVFIVHGHDHGTKETVARYLSRLDMEPVVLHEQPDQGRTIIEKFEHYTNVSCAVVILSSDDTAHSNSLPAIEEFRARQNVIFELGFFVGRLGRKRTFALVEKGLTRPSDIDRVLYISMEDDSWKIKLVAELKAAGMDVDANKAFR